MSDDKKNKNEEPENHDRWLVSYADFITLLFAFFVVMYATSSNNQEKQKSFQDSVRVNLKLAGNGPSGNESAGEEPSAGTGQKAVEVVIPMDGFPKNRGPGETQDYVSRFIEKKLDDEDKTKVQELRHDALGVRIALTSSQFFNPGGTKIKVGALKALDKIAILLKETDRKVVVEGHTDNTPVSKDAPYESNWELASLRATSIVRYFQKYHQIDPKRMSAISYADTRPLKSNDSEEGRSQNRRIEIYIILDDKYQQ